MARDMIRPFIPESLCLRIEITESHHWISHISVGPALEDYWYNFDIDRIDIGD